eukprot:1120573-Prorocentrum_minimum.AAC.3
MAMFLRDGKGRWEAALRLYGDLQAAGVRSDATTCSLVLAACEKGAQWNQAKVKEPATPRGGSCVAR